MPIAYRNGVKIAYEVTGDGPPLLLHPGMFQVGSHWADAGYTTALTAKHTVITIDPLGLGDSDGPADPDAYTLSRRADSVLAVLDSVRADRAALWGYSLGALTGYAVAIHAPERLTQLIAGGFDPIAGFHSAIGPMLEALGLPADTDPFPLMLRMSAQDLGHAAVIERANPDALRANFEAFSRTPGVSADLGQVELPMLMYAGTDDPWHEAIRTFAESAGVEFFSLPNANHVSAWHDSAAVLPHVLRFLGNRQR